MPDLPSLRRRPREPTAYVIGRRASVTRNTRYRWPRRSSELPALSDDKALREELRPASGPQVSRQSIAHGRDGRAALAASLGISVLLVLVKAGAELRVGGRRGRADPAIWLRSERCVTP